jgi:hypothetical protein
MPLPAHGDSMGFPVIFHNQHQRPLLRQQISDHGSFAPRQEQFRPPHALRSPGAEYDGTERGLCFDWRPFFGRIWLDLAFEHVLKKMWNYLELSWKSTTYVRSALDFEHHHNRF